MPSLMPGHRGAWIRYGDPIGPEQIDFAIKHYQVAILQPWEREALEKLKSARPDMIVLTYKCLSSTRDYEPGPYFSSGLGYAEAVSIGEHLFAHRGDGSRIEWERYPRHWQMAVWREDYRDRWVQNVTRELAGSMWDGVMADNDVFGDYYGLRPPLEGGRKLADIRAALDLFVGEAGRALNDIGKILVPNIAESRREPGRWQRHASYGGGFEEVWLGHTAEDYFDVPTALSQMDCLGGPGISIVRSPSDGTNGHRNFTYGLAALWIFGGGRAGTTFNATGHDQYSGTPYIPQLDWDLGEPTSRIRARGNGRCREFTNGWAAANFNCRRRGSVTFRLPRGLQDTDGRPAPRKMKLSPHEGVLFLRADTSRG